MITYKVAVRRGDGGYAPIVKNPGASTVYYGGQETVAECMKGLPHQPPAREIGLKVEDATPQETHAMWELYLGYMRISIEGEGMVGDVPVVIRRLGHIDSSAAVTTGVALIRRSDMEAVGARWNSQWLAEVVGPAPPAT